MQNNEMKNRGQINQTARSLFNLNKKQIKGQTIGSDNREYALCVCKEPLMYLLPNTNQILFSDGVRYDMDYDTRRIVHKYMTRRKFYDGLALLLVTGAIGTAFCVLVVAALYPSEHKKAEIDNKVRAYEKTLPDYLEQKQRVEHFRDSLINAQKGK